ncbi:ogr/Delta-like zinc finger family protein [Halomonas sp. TP35]
MTEEVNEQNTVPFSRLRFNCPHCGSHMKIRTSRSLLPIYRVIYWNCSNEWECGFRCSGFMQMLHTLVPSRCPNPDVQLESSPFLLRQMGFNFDETPVNDEHYEEKADE